MGIDKGNYVGLRAKLSDRSPAGQAAIAKQARELSAKLAAIDTDALSPALALDVEVVGAVFDRSADGFDFPREYLRQNQFYGHGPNSARPFSPYP